MIITCVTFVTKQTIMQYESRHEFTIFLFPVYIKPILPCSTLYRNPRHNQKGALEMKCNSKPLYLLTLKLNSFAIHECEMGIRILKIPPLEFFLLL